MIKTQYIECQYEDVMSLFNGELILLVTVTEVETSVTHSKLMPLEGKGGILKFYKGEYTYYIAKLGKYNVAHIQSSMGSMSRGSSIMTVCAALDCIKAKIVIMVGIAFGVNNKKQHIGDVLVSETIIPYNSKRVGKDSTIQRGVETYASLFLLNRFKSLNTWEYFLEDKTKAKLIPAKLLSGEELIDNIEYRNELIKIYPEVKGGEMEGVGVATACENKIDWILVKGICDFADGKKGKDKKKRQEIAIDSAISLCSELFSSHTVFQEKGIFPSGMNGNKSTNNQVQETDVLFDIYDTNKEKYYVERSEDVEFNNKKEQYGIWIYGPTGCGKSNLILRNLLKNKNNFIQVSLASCIGQKNCFFFNEILSCILEKNDPYAPYPNYKTFPTCSKAILALFEKYYKGKELVIFIEEIPIDSDVEYRNFMNSLFALICDKSLKNGLDRISFILSSINNPLIYLNKNAQKIHQYLYFFPLVYWQQETIQELIKKIEESIQIRLPETVKSELMSSANGSPRFIKKYYRNLLTEKTYSTEILRDKIKETNNELKQFGYA